ncbi:MAG: hypothetical protein KH081_00330 [Azospirillum sp.]|nr:hypothetical protein [Azospirillum sp.]
MSILKHQKLITLFGLSLLMSLSSPAQAQWPTLDLTAIKEGISSKIELVKQSKIVTEATKLGGKMNSAIGDAKSSVTKFAGDNLEKAKKKAEKLQKEKERLEEKKKKLEEKKEKLEKQKKKIEKAKKAMEEAKKLKEDAEKKIQEGKDMVNDVKSQVDEAKQMAADAQAAVNDAKATAQGAIADAKSTVGEVKSTVNDAKSTVGDAVGTVREEKNELQSAIGGQSGSAAADSSFVDDYVAQYEAGINSDAKIYEQMPAADSEAVSETLPAAGDVAAEPADEAETALAPAAGDMSAVVAPEDMPAQQPVAAVTGATQTVTGGKQLNRRPFGRKDMTAGTAAVQSSAVSTVTGTLQTAPSAVSAAAAGQAATPATSAATPSAAVEAAPAAVKTQAVGRSIRTHASAAPSAVSAAAAGQAATSAATPSAAVEAAPAAVKTQAVGRSIRTRASAAPSAVSAAAADQAATPATSAATPSAAVEAAPAAVKTQPARRSFRQRATIKKDNQASLFELKQSVNLAAGSYSETLMFGAEDSGESIPDGVIHNGEYEETIIPDTIVDYCNIGVDQLQDTSVMQNCLKQLITHQSDSDNQVAEEGKALFTKATAEIAIATVAESMQQKVIAAKYQEQVQDKREETLASASTSRDDSGGLAMTNSGEQTLLNALSAMAAAQLSIDAFNQVGGFTKEDLGETEGEDE